MIFAILLFLFAVSLVISDALIKNNPAIRLGGIVFLSVGVLWVSQSMETDKAIIYGLTALVLLVFVRIWAQKNTSKIEKLMNGVQSTENIHVEQKGLTLTSLNPDGTVRINGQRYKATSVKGNIPPNYPIKVVGVDKKTLSVVPETHSCEQNK
jgi:membrane-bound ClpP family serine protease